MKQHFAIQHILPHYFTAPAKVGVHVLGEGNINDTFLARSAEQNLVLQRINPRVFPNPDRLIHNLQLVNQHFQLHPVQKKQRWEDTVLIPTLAGEGSAQDQDGYLWRALSYIDATVPVTKAQTLLQAAQTGWALGTFHKKLAGLAVDKVKIPLPGFHLLSSYLDKYDTLTQQADTSKEGRFCIKSIEKERSTALSLEHAADSGIIHTTVIHGDPKIGNILFDQQTGMAASIIDLDTIGPGFIQHDIGDCLRSTCNRGGETNRTDNIVFDMAFCQATLQEYLREAGQLLNTVAIQYIYDGLRAITFELGLRFFSDYLQGNSYFKCNDPEENLHKAYTQFMLYQDILIKESPIRALLDRKIKR